MSEENNPTWVLQPREIEALFTIIQAVAGAESDTDAALVKITQLLRQVFIFDSVVLYEKSEEGGLEPTFARAIGRGRFREADLAWGEATAQEAFAKSETTLLVEEISPKSPDRTDIRHSLGLPLKLGGQTIGTLVFLRFGGPVFEPEHLQVAEFIAVMVTELLKTNRLARQIASLEARRRLDSLQEDFIATISHELLTPLGFIKGYATTLLRDDTEWDSQTQHEFLTVIDEETDRLRELIDNLMDSSRLQAGTLRMSFQPLRLDTIIRELVQRSRSHSENLDISLNINSPGIEIQGDPGRLTQVFDNIINNAIKYAPGSPLRVKVDLENESACITIQDFGPGIAPEHLDHIFQRFYRVPESSVTARGTGMGLYICRKIVQAHGGEIRAESQVGQGTTFYICLPTKKGK